MEINAGYTSDYSFRQKGLEQMVKNTFDGICLITTIEWVSQSCAICVHPNLGGAIGASPCPLAFKARKVGNISWGGTAIRFYADTIMERI